MGNNEIESLRSGSLILDSTISGNITLGATIPTYYWQDGELVPFDDAFYFAAYAENKIVGIAIIGDPHSPDPNVSFGKRFSDQLNSAIEEFGSEYFLVVNGTQTFYYGNGVAKLLEEYNPGLKPNEPVINGKNADSDEPSASIAPEPIDDGRKVSSGATTQELEGDIAKSMPIFLFSKDIPLKNYSVNGIDITPLRSRASEYKMLNVGTLDQKNTLYCWACSTQLTGSYVTKNYSYDFYDIGNILGIGANAGGNNINMLDGLSICYGITGKDVKGYYSYLNTQFFINKNTPIIAQCYPASGLGHTVTICGYYYNNSRIIISETYGGQANSYVYIEANSDGSFDIYNSGKYYHWMYSITV